MYNNETIPSGSHAAVAMSGGVDSSTAAALLQRNGVHVTGVTMKHKKIGQDNDIADARAVCDTLGITHHVINIVDEYEEFLESQIRGAYARGLTPNPCVMCNEQMKFGLFFNKFLESGQFPADCYWASGHYARIIKNEAGYYHAAKAVYTQKDQSYFLYRLNAAKLARLRFPLGEMIKPEVRKLAGEFGLSVREKADSQDFCLGAEELRPSKESLTKIIDVSGKVLAEGRGISHYTIGQRRGLGVTDREPLFVVDLNAEAGTVTLGRESDLVKKRFTITDAVFTEPWDGTIVCNVKIRSMSVEKPARVYREAGEITIEFEETERAITRGQSAVCYLDDVVLGGGYIDHILN